MCPVVDKLVLLSLSFCFIVGCHRLPAQGNELVKYLQVVEVSARQGKPVSFDEADPILERFGKADDKVIHDALPAITAASRDPDVTVRRLAATALFVAARPDRRNLLDLETPAFAMLIVDPDPPVRRMTGMALENSPLTPDAPLLPYLRAFLLREDATTEVGAGDAGLLLRAAPNDQDTTNAVVHYMQRNDQTAESRAAMLQSVRVSRSHDRAIGQVVAEYATDANSVTAIDAIGTLQAMGSNVLADNRERLRRIAADTNRSSEVRQAAAAAAVSADLK